MSTRTVEAKHFQLKNLYKRNYILTEIPKFKRYTKQLTGKISKQSSTRTLGDVVSNVENPKTNHKESNRARPNITSVTNQPTEVRRVTNNQNGEYYRKRSNDDERPPAAVSAGAVIAHMTNKWLDKEAGKRSAEPYETRPSVRNTELLNIRSEKRELQSPTELNSTCDRCDAE